MNSNISRNKIVTFTLSDYSGHKIWAFAQMGLARGELKRRKGLFFWRLFGTGKGTGFSLKPDWSRYGLLAVWDDISTAEDYFYNSRFMLGCRKYSHESYTVYMKPMSSKGKWDGNDPFESQYAVTNENGPVAVITRATININRLYRFWRMVPHAGKALMDTKGLIVSVGFGEAPFYRQATFSIWKNMDSMKEYAYSNPVHKNIILRTNKEKWYKEDLFARFVLLKTEGTWNNTDPVRSYFAVQKSF